MSKGRKTEPLHLKALKGTLRARDNKDQPKVSEGIPTPPDWLSERSSEIFSTLCGTLLGMRVLSPDHVNALSLLASRLEDVEVLSIVIEDGGRTYQTETRDGAIMHRARPEVAMRNEAMRHAQSLLSDFGLNPSAMSKVSPIMPERENPFAAHRRHR